MYVWVIGKAIPSKKNNMYGSFEFEQASMLAKHGVKVIYVGLDFRPFHRWRKWGMHREQFGEVCAYEFDLPIRPIPFFQNKIEQFFCRNLYRKIEREQGTPDLIHVHFPALRSYYIHEEYQKRGVKIFATEHWTQVQRKELPHWCRKNLNWFVGNADVFACVGEPLKESIIEYTGSNKEIMVIPNIINHEFRYIPQEPKEHFSFIGVGRLVQVKRFDLMIEAFARAFPNNKDIELVIAGGGEKYANLKKQIRGLGVEERIRLLGVLSRAETAQEVQKADALICASNFETFGVPIIEAWACGKPVIGTDALGFLEYMNEELGYIVEHDNLPQMIDAMKNLYERREQFDPAYISEFAVSHFGEDAVANQLIALYKSVMGGETV